MTSSKIYDYLIVGAGSSGAPLAARLSEDAATTVLLLEAGPDYRAADTPVAMRIANPFELWFVPEYEQFRWPGLLARYSDTQRPSGYFRGRGLGGSSAINNQVAIRGMPKDYDRWAELGCKGWASDDVLAAFIRLEDDLDFGDAPMHGVGGPVPIARTPLADWGVVDLALREAALDLGYEWADDHNAPGSIGVSPFAANCRNDVRVSTNDGYLEPARSRANLRICGEVEVDRVVFEGRRAVGVRARTPTGLTEFRASEVIIAAGAIGSPAILLRSGIGPASQLRTFGVAVVQDAPVGRNLADHPAATLTLQLQPHARATRADARLTNCCVRYSSGLAGAGANDMILMSHNIWGSGEAGIEVGSLLASVYQTYSRGAVRLASPDPDDYPEVDLRLLSDERDLIRMIDGVRRMIAIAQHPAIDAIAERVVFDDEGRTPEMLANDTALADWLRSRVASVQHAAGTCRMGAPDDPHTVVDPECRVLGVEHLRVIDASIMPDIPRANIHLTCCMIAEHMATQLRRR